MSQWRAFSLDVSGESIGRRLYRALNFPACFVRDAFVFFSYLAGYCSK